MSSGTAHSDLVTKARTSVSILIKSDFLLEPELVHLHVQPNSLDGPFRLGMCTLMCSAVFQFLVQSKLHLLSKAH